jgi:hypothetical protein
MQIAPFRAEVSVPANGSVDFPVELERTLRESQIEINVPLNPTLETYILPINAFNPDYDASISSLDLELISGTNIPSYFNGIDSLVFTPETGGLSTYRLTATDTRGDQVSTDISMDVESFIHLVQTLDFFGNLGGPYEGARVVLRGTEGITNSEGLLELEVSTTNGPLNETDTMQVYSLNNDSTFYALNWPVDAAADTQKVQTYTDNHGPSFWANSPWVNQWNRESTLAITNGMPNFQFRKVGNLDDGQASIINIYCPNYTSPQGLEYRPIIEQELDSLNNALDERAGPGRQSKVHFFLTNNTLEDSLYVNDNGIMLHFIGTHNYTEINTETDASQDLLYIRNTDAYVAYNAANNETGVNGIRRLFVHEAIQHGTGLIGHTPYNLEHPENQENMSAGAYELKEHEIDGLFTRYNYKPSHIRNFQGYEHFHELHLDQTQNRSNTSIPQFTSPDVSYQLIEKEGNIEKGRITIRD